MKQTVNLYTRQHIHSLYELERTGIITNKEIYIKLHMKDISDFFLEKYKIFTKMANTLVPSPDENSYPIWCSVSKNNCLKPIQNEVVYCLEVPINEVIYFDGQKWDFVLNNLYIPKDETDKKLFDEVLKNENLNGSYSLFTGKNKNIYPYLEEKIKNSWKRIFDIDDWDEFTVQANIWYIKKEWVKHIIHKDENLFDITKDMPETFPPINSHWQKGTKK